MRVVSLSTTLDAPAEVIWRAARSPAAFTFVAGRMLRYPAAGRLAAPWRQGQRIRGVTLLFGVIPFSIHHLCVESMDDERRVLVSDEHGGILRRWRHEIWVGRLDARRSAYRDRIEIDAGPFTALVAGYARAFVAYRQRRWRAVAPLLAAAAG